MPYQYFKLQKLQEELQAHTSISIRPSTPFAFLSSSELDSSSEDSLDVLAPPAAPPTAFFLVGTYDN